MLLVAPGLTTRNKRTLLVLGKKEREKQNDPSHTMELGSLLLQTVPFQPVDPNSSRVPRRP